jgi:hypothetical protein
MSVEVVSNVCNSLIVDLNTQSNLPASFLESIGTYYALNSRRNVSGYEDLKLKVRNELKEKEIPNNTFPNIFVNYEKPSCGDCSVDEPTSPCAYGSTGGSLYGTVQVKVGGYREVEFTLTNAQFEQVCYGKTEYMQTKMRQKSQELLRAVNSDLSERVQAIVGNYTDGTSSLTNPRTINLLDSKLAPNVMVMPLVESEYDMMGYNNGVIKVGGAYMNLYNKALKLSIGNTFTGLDATKLPDLEYYYDSKIDSLNPEGCTLLTWGVGAIQMLEAYRYEGSKSWIMEQSVRRTMAVDGFEFDFSMEFDTCTSGGKWVIKLSKSYDLFYVPDTEFTCNKGGSNFKLQYLLGCGDMTCSDLHVCPAS